MELNEYQALAQRTSNTKTNNEKMLNGLLGLSGETGECSDIVKKHLYQGHVLNQEDLVEELGDVMWYIAELASGIGVTLEGIAKCNIQKLIKRYPDGFDPIRSQNRE